MTYLVINRNQLKSDLKEYVAEVVFDKMDGERRMMRCTLRPDYLPEQYRHPDTHPILEEEDNKPALAVWDVLNGGWRSFRLDRVISCQIMPGYQ